MRFSGSTGAVVVLTLSQVLIVSRRLDNQVEERSSSSNKELEHGHGKAEVVQG